MKSWTAALIFVAAICMSGGKKAEGQLRWPDPPKRASMRVRLVAVALAVPRSSFFSSSEVFIAETEIGNEEWSLIKLVFTFLPYQPGLLDAGFDYSVIHELSAQRDPECDETVEQLTARSMPSRHEQLIYSRHVPKENLDRRRIPLPCYETNADEYIRSSTAPGAPSPQPIPFLEDRSTVRAMFFFQPPLVTKPIPSFEESLKPSLAQPRPIPFFDEPTSAKPIPFFEERSTSKPIPFLEEPSGNKPVPALKRYSDVKPTPSRKGRLTHKPTPPAQQHSNPE